MNRDDGMKVLNMLGSRAHGSCPACGQPKDRFVPAGKSKRTGRPYRESWACSTPDCRPPAPPSRPYNYTHIFGATRFGRPIPRTRESSNSP